MTAASHTTPVDLTADRSGQVYQHGTGTDRVYGYIYDTEVNGSATDKVGMPACQAGVASTYRCGTISNTNVYADYPAKAW